MTQEFLGNPQFNISSQAVSASCPSNIALIKYWGKYENQIPANPSISYTLNHCRTNTTMEFSAGEEFAVQTFLSGNEEQKFAEKIEKYFKNIEQYLPWILKGKYVIKTENTFPHSSGIASSASGFGAIAKCLMNLDDIFTAKDEGFESLSLTKKLQNLFWSFKINRSFVIQSSFYGIEKLSGRVSAHPSDDGTQFKIYFIEWFVRRDCRNRGVVGFRLCLFRFPERRHRLF